MKDYLPDWAHPWLDVITLGLQIVLIVAAALLLRSLVVRIITRLDRHLGA